MRTLRPAPVQSGPEDERLEAIYDRLDELDPTTFEPRAAQLLHGLGFSAAMMKWVGEGRGVAREPWRCWHLWGAA